MRAIFAIFFATSIAVATPIRQVPAPPRPAALPDLGGEWSYFGSKCVIEQRGRILTIDGPRPWKGNGEIRANGSLLVHWQCNGRPALGTYRVSAGDLTGNWGYCDVFPQTTLDEKGDVAGPISAEAFNRPPVEP
jgi:hypothetical protein